MLQIKLRSLILDLVHMLDVVRKLANAGVNSIGDWLWQKQLRFYLVKDVSTKQPKFAVTVLPIILNLKYRHHPYSHSVLSRAIFQYEIGDGFYIQTNKQTTLKYNHQCARHS